MEKLSLWKKYPEYINSEVFVNKFPYKSLYYKVLIPKKGPQSKQLLDSHEPQE